MKKDMKRFELKRLFLTLLGMALVVTAQSQLNFTSPTTVYVMHSSGNHLKMASDYGGQLEAATAANAQQMTIVPDGKGYYYIRTATGKRYLSKLNTWNTTFVTDSASDDARFSFEQAQGAYIRIRCQGNGPKTPSIFIVHAGLLSRSPGRSGAGRGCSR